MTTSEAIFKWLEDEGYRPQFDEDKDILFKIEGLPFYYLNHDEDENFLRFAVPGIYEVTDDNRNAILQYANEINVMFKNVKAFITSADQVWISSESWSDTTPVFDDFLPRIFSVLKDALVTFFKLLEE